MSKALLKTEGKKVTTHKQIMHTAKKLFEEEGISGVKIERIAHETGISRSTFFTHFNSLDQLLSELADEVMEHIIAWVYAEKRQKCKNLTGDGTGSAGRNVSVHQRI